MTAAEIRRWAKDMVGAELRNLMLSGYACNVQTWSRPGVKSKVALCRAKRAAARRLVLRAIKAL